MSKPIIAVLAILLAILAQAIINDQLPVSIVLYAASAGLLLVALESRAPLLRLRDLVRLNAAMIASIILLVAAMNFYAGDMNSAFGFYAFLIGVVFFFLGQDWNDRFARGYRLQRNSWRWAWVLQAVPQEHPETMQTQVSPFTLRSAPITRAEIILLAAILLLGFVLRVYQIDQFPSGISSDEARPALEAIRVMQNPAFRPVFIPVLHNAAPDVYVLAVLFSFLGTGVLVLKIWPLVAGVAGIVAFYFLCRDHFDQRVALAGAFLIAISHWHIHFSRLAEGPILVPLFATLTVLFLLRGLATQRRMDFVWAGGALAMGMYSYLAFYLFPLVVIIFLVYQAVAVRGFVQTHAVNLIRFAIAAAVVLSPLLLFAVLHTDLFLFRGSQVFLGNNLGNADFVSRLLGNISKAFLMFNYHGAEWPEHNLPGEPMFDPVTGILFVLGLGIALWNWRKPLFLFALLWFSVMSMSSVLTYENPHATRNIATLAVVCLFAVILLDRLWASIAPVMSSPLLGRLMLAVIGGVTLAVALFNITTYFDRMQNNSSVWLAYEPEVNSVGHRIAQLRDQADVYLSPRFQYSPIVRFLSYRAGDNLDAPPFYTLFEEVGTLPLRQPSSRDVVFVFQYNNGQTLKAVNAYYPNGRLTDFKDRAGKPLTEYYTVTQSQVAAGLRSLTETPAHGLIGYYYSNENWQGTPQRRIDATVDFDWGNFASESPFPGSFSVRWVGEIEIKQAGQYSFGTASDDGSMVYIDDQLVIDNGGQHTVQRVNQFVTLAAGRRKIRIDYFNLDGDKSMKFLWLSPETDLYAPVPSAVLYPKE